MNKRSANRITLLIFAPVLILTGLAGFIIPSEKGLTSGEPLYNTFHIVFGLIGIAVLLTGKERWMEGFNIGFGLIDLYQAVASFTHLFPERYFRWTRADDVLHIILGLALIVIGCYGKSKRGRHATWKA
ncbi:MAG TPA: hypothetical protein VM095_01710 [Pyrinomonadaceae bacterium]|nr:hypothetical protein [Pyrinomonadaceae bacterium]